MRRWLGLAWRIAKLRTVTLRSLTFATRSIAQNAELSAAGLITLGSIVVDLSLLIMFSMCGIIH